jgi:chemotaxis protein CheZ
MPNHKPSHTDLLALYAQIEEMCKEFSEIRGQAAGIINQSQMPDAALHLNDVLQATEDATNSILDAAGAIAVLAQKGASPDKCKEDINAQVNRIYEACSFQDISGQRIKKVLQHMTTLETQLLRLAQTAKGHKTTLAPTGTPLLNGPQLTSQAPSQSQVDDLFSKEG